MYVLPGKVGALLAVAATAIWSTALRANINLELRESESTICDGGIVEFALYAISDDETNQGTVGMEVILLWDPSKLELMGRIDNGPYIWLASFFPNDSGLDGLNAPFSGPAPFVPANDGDALYSCFAQFAPNPPAFATPEGLLVTTFLFRAAGPGEATVEIPAQYGMHTVTQIMHGTIPGLAVTGTLTPGSTTVSCQSPALTAEGGRRIRIDSPSCAAPVAFFVTGDAKDDDVSCVSGYVQNDGTLGATAVFRTSQEWGEVLVLGPEIRPGESFQVQSDCGVPDAPARSDASSATTYAWGDMSGDGNVDLDDIVSVLDAFAGVFVNITLERADIGPCLPNGSIDLDDIVHVLDAFAGIPYELSCPAVCP